MAVMWADKTQVVSYIPRSLKDRVVRLRRYDHRMTMSRVIEDALWDKVPSLEKQLKPQSHSPKFPRG